MSLLSCDKHFSTVAWNIIDEIDYLRNLLADTWTVKAVVNLNTSSSSPEINGLNK